MRALILSDIHDNIEHLRLLREKENDVYEAIIVAGDIGNEIAEEFFSILDSFNCPSFCVYGNWDHDLTYEIPRYNNCVLLHHNIEEVEGFFVTGFSGCLTSWGKNPIYLAHKNQLNEKYSAVLFLLDNVKKCVEEQKQELDRRYQKDLESLFKEAKDRRRKEYKRRVARLELRKELEIEKIGKAIEKVYKTREYKKYQEDRSVLSKATLIDNRNLLFKKIRSSGVPQNKLIIVTHERMYKIAEEGMSPLLHIFGHAHEYKFGLFKGTYYLNAAAIDNGMSESFGRKKLLPEGYCDVTILEGAVTVIRKFLFSDNDSTSLNSAAGQGRIF